MPSDEILSMHLMHIATSVRWDIHWFNVSINHFIFQDCIFIVSHSDREMHVCMLIYGWRQNRKINCNKLKRHSYKTLTSRQKKVQRHAVKHFGHVRQTKQRKSSQKTKSKCVRDAVKKKKTSIIVNAATKETFRYWQLLSVTCILVLTELGMNKRINRLPWKCFKHTDFNPWHLSSREADVDLVLQQAAQRDFSGVQRLSVWKTVIWGTISFRFISGNDA